MGCARFAADASSAAIEKFIEDTVRGSASPNYSGSPVGAGAGDGVVSLPPVSDPDSGEAVRLSRVRAAAIADAVTARWLCSSTTAPNAIDVGVLASQITDALNTERERLEALERVRWLRHRMLCLIGEF